MAGTRTQLYAGLPVPAAVGPGNLNATGYATPANKSDQLIAVRAHVTTTATVGNRQFALMIGSGLAIINNIVLPAGVVQTASLTCDYMFYPGAALAAAFVGSYAWAPMPEMPLVPGLANAVTLIDMNAIDVTDQVTLSLYVYQSDAENLP